MLFEETVAVYCENHTEHTGCREKRKWRRKQETLLLKGRGKKYSVFFGFEGSQAVPAGPSGRGMFERG
jgi:hypothetical protein